MTRMDLTPSAQFLDQSYNGEPNADLEMPELKGFLHFGQSIVDLLIRL